MQQVRLMVWPGKTLGDQCNNLDVDKREDRVDTFSHLDITGGMGREAGKLNVCTLFYLPILN